MLKEETNYLNKVIKSNESIGVIKYYGNIVGFNETEKWFGVEWRDHSRGKHDGSFKGIRYFQTKHPTGGSFIRPNLVEFGIDIWKAVVSKYFENDVSLDENDKYLYNNFTIDEKKGLECISLSDSNVSSIETIEVLSEKFPNVKELDLDKNLLNSWSQIFTILKHLKQIKTINLSNNILKTDELDNESIVFENVERLIINRMDYNWNDVLKVVKHFPNLTELKVCFNFIQKIINVTASLKENLKILDLESNPIKEWNNFKRLGELKNLETLYANDTGVSEIIFDDCNYSSKTQLFPKLTTLALCENRIDSWKSINELNKLQNLTELRLRSNPINQLDRADTVRQFVIVKLEKLTILNRTIVNVAERLGAEVDYLKRFGHEWIEANKLEDKTKLNDFKYNHPTYEKLVKRHEKFIELRETESEPETLKSSLISIIFKDNVSGKTLEKKIPSSIEIKRLKILISKLFKYSSMDIESIQLFYSSSKVQKDEFELDNDFRPLSFYSVENGDVIRLKLNK